MDARLFTIFLLREHNVVVRNSERSNNIWFGRSIRSLCTGLYLGASLTFATRAALGE